ncbi:hypothetical protein CAPTEDRAFT_200216 [Capitella teleta]|uniref:G-protein coupled receptors family 3 profile domain-containing protein n=1 Tax=Capitella teleta TaxID=283909 RepID=R7UWY9_CAPTE|nr:hypothetical protein CAPTEDRAFT_200216 [Capitella teleta]|eukprot:ELU10782.1 hypothetical protein CAPTEDRAFT_200216 [Capitella teleta]
MEANNLKNGLAEWDDVITVSLYGLYFIVMPSAEMHFSCKSVNIHCGHIPMLWGSPSVASRELFHALQDEPTKIMLLGGFPSHVAVAVAQTARWWNMIQISPAAFDPDLSQRTKYPYFFRTRAALTTFNAARKSLLDHFSWTRIAIIARQTDYFITTTDMMTVYLEDHGIDALTTEVYQTEAQPMNEIKRIKQLDARIVFVFAFEEHARKIFCQHSGARYCVRFRDLRVGRHGNNLPVLISHYIGMAIAYRAGLIDSRHVWIMHYGNNPRWMDKGTDDGLCSVEDIRRAADGHLVIRDVTLREDDVIPLCGLSVQQFLHEYHQMAEAMGVAPSDFYAPLTYDAIWSLVLALNDSVRRLQDLDMEPLHNFTYESEDMARVMMQSMNALRFEAMGGVLSYSESGDISTLQATIQQFRDDEYITVARHYSYDDNMVWLNEIKWKNGRVPLDSVRTITTQVLISLPIYYTMSAMALFGVVLAATFLWFNISQRHTKLIRMSSPNLNNVVIIGCTFAYISIIFYGLDSRYAHGDTLLAACQLRMILLAFGFSLGFGALFAKTWRVFKIFTNKSAKRVVIHDGHLLGLVGGFLAMDVILFVFWFSLDPLALEEIKADPQEDPENPDYLIVRSLTRCSSKNGGWVQLIFYGIKGVVLIFGVFLAWQTRQVSIPALNDSKYIGVAVYNLMILCMTGVPASFVLGELLVDLLFGLVAACIFASTSITMCVVFVPKILVMKNGGMANAITNTVGDSTAGTSTVTNLTTVCEKCRAICPSSSFKSSPTAYNS